MAKRKQYIECPDCDVVGERKENSICPQCGAVMRDIDLLEEADES